MSKNKKRAQRELYVWNLKSDPAGRFPTDYFLKIEGGFNKNKIQELTKKINTIHNVMTTYELNPKTLKSKDFLIF